MIVHAGDPFVEALSHLCRASVARAKWVFVPSHSLGRVLNERLALSGTNTVNLRFVTPLDIALRMGAPFLVERGLDPSEEGLGPALIMRLLLDLPEKDGYFRSLADQPPLAQALWSTIRELRMCGLKSTTLPSDAFAVQTKHAELRALLASYETFLEANGRGDVATVYDEAMRHLDWCPIQPGDCWTTWPEAIWAPLQHRLLETMPGDRIEIGGPSLPGATRPRRMGQHATGGSGEASVTPLQLNAASIDLFHAGGRDAEIEEIGRRILHSGLPLDEIEIACASSEHAGLAWEKALRHEWPVTMGPGVPAAMTRPGRAVLAFCEWIESDFHATNLRRLLQSGDLRFDLDDLTPGQAARLLIKAETGWGRATYDLSLRRLAKGYLAAAGNKDLAEDVRDAVAAKARRTEMLHAWVTELLASVPAEDTGGAVALQDCVTAALDFLHRCAAKGNALDAAAHAALVVSIEELRALGPFQCRLASALRFIRERVEGLAVANERPRPGHLHVSMLAQSAYAGRRLLFVAGLEEGRVFPGAVEDPVLLDEERLKIHDALRLSKDRVDEAVWVALSRLSTHNGPIVFSYSSRDTREYRETYASWLMLQAFRWRERDTTRSYGDLRKALGQAKSAVPDKPSDAATEAGWWLSTVKPAGKTVEPQVLQHFPLVAQGRFAQSRRDSAAFTEFDGHVPEAGKVLDPVSYPFGISPTALEEAATCGFKHFLRRGLRLDAVDDGERDGDIWLTPLVRGGELHDLYAAALRRSRNQKRRLDRSRDLEWLLDAARKQLDMLRIEMPPPSDEVYEREVADFLSDLELFLDAESEGEAGRTAIGLEVAFGSWFGDEEDSEPLALKAPIEIDLGRGLKFRVTGRIDRIDQIGPSTFQVIDYKTGSYWAPKWEGVFAAGTRLQHAIYGLAAVELLKRHHKNPKVTEGVYYFPTVKGGKERRIIPAPSRASLTQVLGDLRDVIAQGLFAHTGDAGNCTFCDYSTGCGSPHAVKSIEAKRQDTLLAARVRLAANE